MKKTFAKLLACGAGLLLLSQSALSAAAIYPEDLYYLERFDAESISAALGKEIVEIYSPIDERYGSIYTKDDRAYHYERIRTGLSVTYADGTAETVTRWMEPNDAVSEELLSDPNVIRVENCYEYWMTAGYDLSYCVMSDQPLTEASFSVPCSVVKQTSHSEGTEYYEVSLPPKAPLPEDFDYAAASNEERMKYYYTDKEEYQLYLSNLEAIRSGEGVVDAYIAMWVFVGGQPDYILSSAEHESILFRGDLDGSGDLGLRDAVLSAKLLGEDHTANVLTQNADMNADGCLDLRDFRLLVQRLS